MSTDEWLRSATIEGGSELARADVRYNRIFGRPERSDFPSFNLPNRVGARGFSPSYPLTHGYLVPVNAPAALRGRAGLSAIGAALTANPTPGKDLAATETGTDNDVGPLVPGDGGDNFVRSFLVVSADPRRSAMVVNYTIANQHVFHEGFVMRFAELRPDGSIVLITYGEGNAFSMSRPLSVIWKPQVDRAWTKNAKEIFQTASSGK